MYHDLLRAVLPTLDAALSAGADTFRCRAKKESGATGAPPHLQGDDLGPLLVRVDDPDLREKVVSWVQDASAATWGQGWRVAVAGLLAGQELPQPARRSVAVQPTLSAAVGVVDVAPLLSRTAAPSASSAPSALPVDHELATRPPVALVGSIMPPPVGPELMGGHERAGLVSSLLQMSEQMSGLSGSMINLLRENRLSSEGAMKAQQQMIADQNGLISALLAAVMKTSTAAADGSAKAFATATAAAEARAQQALEYGLVKSGEVAEYRALLAAEQEKQRPVPGEQSDEAHAIDSFVDLAKTVASLRATGAPPVGKAVPFMLGQVAQGDPSAVAALTEGVKALSPAQRGKLLKAAAEAMDLTGPGVESIVDLVSGGAA